MKQLLLDKLTRLANSLYKTLFKKDKAKLKKYDKASRKAGSEAELKRITRQAINEVKGKDPRTDALIKRFEDRAFKKKVSELPKFTSKPNIMKKKEKRKVLSPQGKETARFTSPGKVKLAKEKAALKSLKEAEKIPSKAAPKKLTKDVTKSKELPQFTSKPSSIKGNIDKATGKRLPIGKRKSLIPKGPSGQSAQLKKLNVAKKEQKTKEFNKLKQDYKNTKDPVKKRTLKDKLKIAAAVIGLGAGALAFLTSDPKVTPTKTKPNNNNKNIKNNKNNKNIKNNKNNNAQTSTIDAGEKRRKRLIEENRRAMELRKRERLKDQAAANAKKKRLQRNKKAKQPSKLVSKYDKYDYYDPSFLGIRSRLKKK